MIKIQITLKIETDEKKKKKKKKAPTKGALLLKVKTCFDTKCTPGQPFVIKFELLLNSAHP